MKSDERTSEMLSASTSSSARSDITRTLTPNTSTVTSSYNTQVPSKTLAFSSVTAEHLKYLGVTIKSFSNLRQEASLPFRPMEDVKKATKDFLKSLRKAHGNHSLVTYMFLEDAAKLSTLRHPSSRFFVCTDKKYNDLSEVGPIKNMKTGNALILRGVLPNLITRFEGTPDDGPPTFGVTELSTKYYQSFVLRTLLGCLYERLPEAIAHALALSHVSGRKQVHFALTDGQEWMFALLRQDSDTAGWTALISSRHDMERVDMRIVDDDSSGDEDDNDASSDGDSSEDDFSDDDIDDDDIKLPRSIKLYPRLPLIMDLLLHWIDGTDNEAHESDPGGKDIVSFLPTYTSRKTPIPPTAISFSSVTLEDIGDLGAEIRPFTHPPRPSAQALSKEEIQATDKLFKQLKEAREFCVEKATGIPSMALGLFLVGLARVFAIRIPGRRLDTISNLMYDGGYKTFGIDNNLIPFKNVKTGRKVTLQGSGNNVVFEYKDKLRDTLHGFPSFRGQFLPSKYPSFVFEASCGPSVKLSESFAPAIAQGMTICRCSEKDRVYFCVTDFQRWVFFLLRRNIDDEDHWTAFQSEEHDTAWIPGEDGGKPNPHLRFVLQLLLEWVDSTASRKHLESDSQ